MDTCIRCNKDLATVTEDTPCDICTYVYDDKEPSADKELNFNEGTTREYQPDFHEMYDKPYSEDEE